MDPFTPLYLALAFIANVAAQQTGTQAELQAYAATEIPKRLAEVNTNSGGLVTLELAWGPAVYQAPDSDVADNVMYVARNTGLSGGYIVAVAGTNPRSAFDWLIEDGVVEVTVPWNSTQTSTGRIALGTGVGLTILQGLSSVPTIPAGSTSALSLIEFLKQQVGDSGTKVYVTGHSLGGALAPVVGLWLRENRSYWGNSNATVNVYAFAGPTPGDETFAAYYENKLGTGTTRVWNELDVVPHAWSQETPPDLSQLPDLYDELPANSRVVPDKVIDDLATLLKLLSGGTDYTPVNSAAGFSYQGADAYADVTECDSALGKFLVQAVWQHIQAYWLQAKLVKPDKVGPPLLTCAEVNQIEAELEAKIEKELAARLSSTTASATP